MLCARGLAWVLTDARTQRLLLPLLGLAVIVGAGKGVWVLWKSARGGIARIQGLATRTPCWQLYSPTTYLLVAAMIGFGIGCRWVGAHWHVFGFIGVLYLTIGMALLVGSYPYWRAQLSPDYPR